MGVKHAADHGDQQQHDYGGEDKKNLFGPRRRRGRRLGTPLSIGAGAMNLRNDEEDQTGGDVERGASEEVINRSRIEGHEGLEADGPEDNHRRDRGDDQEHAPAEHLVFSSALVDYLLIDVPELVPEAGPLRFDAVLFNLCLHGHVLKTDDGVANLRKRRPDTGSELLDIAFAAEGLGLPVECAQRVVDGVAERRRHLDQMFHRVMELLDGRTHGPQCIPRSQAIQSARRLRLRL